MIKVKFVLPYKGTENNPADYKKDDEAELSEDAAWNLAVLGVVKFETVPDEVIAEAKQNAKKARAK
jgi:hypothetical protein